MYCVIKVNRQILFLKRPPKCKKFQVVEIGSCSYDKYHWSEVYVCCKALNTGNTTRTHLNGNIIFTSKVVD